LTGAANNVPQAPATPIRRFFSDERKLAIVKETEQPGVTVSGIARKHGNGEPWYPGDQRERN
jgi:transposase-like protein